MSCNLQQLHEDYFAIDPVTGQIVPINSAAPVLGSIDEHTDVDTTTVAPVAGDNLEWNGANWVPNKLDFGAAPTTCGGLYAGADANSQLLPIYKNATGELVAKAPAVDVGGGNNSAVCITWGGTLAVGASTPYLTGTTQSVTNTSCRPMRLIYTLDYSASSTTQDNARSNFELEVSENGGAFNQIMNPAIGGVANGGNIIFGDNWGITAAITIAAGATYTWQLRMRVTNNGTANLVISPAGCVATRYSYFTI